MTSIPNLTEFEAILFDFDGTLVELHIDFAAMKRQVVALAAENGVVGCDHLFTLELIKIVYEKLWPQHHKQALDFRRRAEAAVIAEEMRAAPKVKVYSGVPELLRDLRGQGIRVGIVTRNCRQVVEEIIRRNALPYDLLLTRDDVPRVKPNPEHLQIALRTFQVLPAHALMVGDHPADVEAGRAAGTWTIGILHDDRPADYFAAVRPDAVLASVVQIPKYLASRS